MPVTLGYLCLPAPGPGPDSSPNLYLTTWPPICIYRPWLIRIRNNKSKVAYNVAIFILLSNSFVTVIVDRNETKNNLSKNQVNK